MSWKSYRGFFTITSKFSHSVWGYSFCFNRNCIPKQMVKNIRKKIRLFLLSQISKFLVHLEKQSNKRNKVKRMIYKKVMFFDFYFFLQDKKTKKKNIFIL